MNLGEVRYVTDLHSEEYCSTIYCNYRKHWIYSDIWEKKKAKATCWAPEEGFQLGFIMIYNLSLVFYWQSWTVEGGKN